MPRDILLDLYKWAQITDVSPSANNGVTIIGVGVIFSDTIPAIVHRLLDWLTHK